MRVQTSITNPLRIAALPFGTGGGLIGITFAPGKQQRDGKEEDGAEDHEQPVAERAGL